MQAEGVECLESALSLIPDSVVDIKKERTKLV